MSGSLLTVLAVDTPPAQHSLGFAIGTAIIALLAMLTLWPIIDHSVTAAHEGGHALMGSVVGGTVKSVRLERRKSKRNPVTDVDAGWFGHILTGLAGYLGPSLFGLLGALLLTLGQSIAVLWLSLAFLLLLLLRVANPFGFLVVIGTGAAVVSVLLTGSATIQTVFAYTWIWILLIGGFLQVLELRRIRREAKQKGKRDEGSDAYGLRKLTFLPAALWVGVFWLGSLSALIFGAAMLLGLASPTR